MPIIFDPVRALSVGWEIWQSLQYNVPFDIFLQVQEGKPGEDIKMPIGKLRLNLLKNRVLGRPAPANVHGVFMPYTLLGVGWWEKKNNIHNARVLAWDNNIKKWLYEGFIQWGPSYELNSSYEHDHIIGQIGKGDEANSIPVIICPGAGKEFRELFSNLKKNGYHSEVAYDVRAYGLLVHRSHLRKHLPDLPPDKIKQCLSSHGRMFDYWLVIQNNNPHRFEVEKTSDVYSGYLWKCVMPEDLYIKYKESPLDTFININETYYIWEHTNLANIDSIQYNIDSLNAKQNYINKKFGEVVILQKSFDFLPGDPVPDISRDLFYDKIRKML